MNMPPDVIWQAIRMLAAAAFVLQSIEFLWIRDTFNDKGIWRLTAVAADFGFFPRPAQSALKFVLKYDNFIAILIVRLLASLLLFFSGNRYVSALLLVFQLLIALRWRGTFNGGSDYMSVIVLIGVCISELSSAPEFQLAGLYYVCFHAVSSYFFAGIAKLKNPDWRNGSALRVFMNNTIYGESRLLGGVFGNRLFARVVSLVVISWEILFPFSLLHINTTVVFLAAGVLFHLFNAYIIGLNRFFFIWLATYPALLYVAR